MSKIGQAPIEIPEGVTLEVKSGVVKVTGPKGSLEFKLTRNIEVEVKNGEALVTAKNKTRHIREMFGTTRAILANMVKGVKDGWEKKLELVGTGYRAEVAGNKLSLTVGYSHPVEIEAPEGIGFKVEKLDVTVEGPDKHLVGEIAAKIRAIRPPEPYKGKGIKYKDEVVRRKPGKAAKGVGVGGAA